MRATDWGNLPPKEREEALQQLGKDLPSHYRDVIEEYFRKLARDGVQPYGRAKAKEKEKALAIGQFAALAIVVAGLQVELEKPDGSRVRGELMRLDTEQIELQLPQDRLVLPTSQVRTVPPCGLSRRDAGGDGQGVGRTHRRQPAVGTRLSGRRTTGVDPVRARRSRRNWRSARSAAFALAPRKPIWTGSGTRFARQKLPGTF